MSAFPLLITCLLLGVFMARIANPPPTLAGGLNWWVINIALPALVLDTVPTLRLQWNLWFLIVAMWLMFACSWALFAWLGKLFNWSHGRVGALTLTCGLSNTAFMGFPMIEALRGKEGLGYAIVADQLGCFVMLALGGALVTAIYSGGRVDSKSVARRVLTFPAFMAFIAGLIAGAWGGWPAGVEPILSRISSTLTPLALFSVGLQMQFRYASGQVGAATLGVAYKLALAPLGIYLLGAAFGISGLALAIGVLQAAMAPMISAAILADQNNLEPKLANLTLIAGIVLSLGSVPLINSLL